MNLFIINSKSLINKFLHQSIYLTTQNIKNMLRTIILFLLIFFSVNQSFAQSSIDTRLAAQVTLRDELTNQPLTGQVNITVNLKQGGGSNIFSNI